MGKVPLTSPGSVMLAARMRALRTKNPALFRPVHPRLILELASRRPNQLARRIIRTVNEAGREQFSGSSPGVIWTHMNFMSKEVFRSLSTSQHGMTCLFDGIANAVYRSEKRSHISQLCFTGGSFLDRTGETGWRSGGCLLARPHLSHSTWWNCQSRVIAFRMSL